MFACCYAALSMELQVALSLKTLCGFSVGEIARAFLLPEETIAKRLTRAKQRLREAAVPFGSVLHRSSICSLMRVTTRLPKICQVDCGFDRIVAAHV